jgi:hypothetical protein
MSSPLISLLLLECYGAVDEGWLDMRKLTAKRVMMNKLTFGVMETFLLFRNGSCLWYVGCQTGANINNNGYARE